MVTYQRSFPPEAFCAKYYLYTDSIETLSTTSTILHAVTLQSSKKYHGLITTPECSVTLIYLENKQYQVLIIGDVIISIL